MSPTYRAEEFSTRRREGLRPGLFLGSLFVAFVLTILPLPEWAIAWRPYWVALVMIYWALIFPSRVGVLAAWITGLLLDVLTGSLLGLHAPGLSIITYIALLIHRRARLWPLWQQAFIVATILLNDRIITLWIRGLLDQEVGGWEFWVSPLVGGLLWPWAWSLLHALQSRGRRG